MAATLRIPLTTSLYLDALHELNTIDANAVQISPGDFADWNAMFVAHPDALDYLLTPGDYRSWGQLQKQDFSIPSGTQERRRTIRYYDPNTEKPLHPVHRVGGSEAVIDSADIRSGSHIVVDLHRVWIG